MLKFKMNHSKFRALSVFVAFLCSGSITGYDYLFLTQGPVVSIKLLPPLFLMGLTASHFLIYQVTIYSILHLFFLIFCFFGDLLMSFYIGKDISPIIAGGFFFTAARIIFGMNMLGKSKSEYSFLKYDLLRFFIASLLFNLFSIILILCMLVFVVPPISYLISVYIFVGFGFQLSLSFLRIGEIKNETYFSSIIAFTGFLIFNISDVLLFLTLFTNLVPKYCELIAINIYWLGIYLITLSIVRTSTDYLEKEDLIII